MGSVDSVLGGIKEIQSILDDAKESIGGGLHLRLCNATLAAYELAEAAKAAKDDSRGGDDDDGDDDDGDDDDGIVSPGTPDDDDDDGSVLSESNSEPRERTEEDMGLNELAELWESQFDYSARPIDDLIETIMIDDEMHRVCAAVRVLNRVMLAFTVTDDPADAEQVLKWKEQLIDECAIRECADILQGDREFSCTNNDDNSLYPALGDEILQLFQRIGMNDALFRTKLRRNGALKAVEAYHAKGLGYQTHMVLRMLKHR